MFKQMLMCLFISNIKCETLNQSDDNSIFITIQSQASNTSVQGTKNSTWQGHNFYAFRGIPYAQAPIGRHRFKDPKALVDLPTYIDARYDGHDCPSIYAQNASEDCLILNIYTKVLQPTKLLPVLFFIHPGGLYIGSSLSTFIGPEYLLSKALVLVTFNYRLGTCGFLQLGTAEYPGNAGFKDQVHALRWIQKYIRYFGGNAADVTLMGYSAGALSVSLHLVSPMSQGLFAKAIVMSGALPPQIMLPVGQQMNLAIKQAKALNCTVKEDGPTVQDILKCLNEHSGSEIAATLRQLFEFGKDNPIYLWLPVIEHDFGQERFIVEDYYEALKRDNFYKVPLLVGFTDGELCTSAADILQDEHIRRRFFNEYLDLAGKIFMYDAHNITDSILRHHYDIDNEMESVRFRRLCDFFSDALIRFGAKRLSDYVAQYMEVFNYMFTYRGKYSNLNCDSEYNKVDFGNSEYVARTEHLDDLMYLFRMEPHRFEPGETDSKIVELYVDFMYNFMKNGKLDYVYPHGYALINSQVEQKSGKNFQNAVIWEQLFP